MLKACSSKEEISTLGLPHNFDHFSVAPLSGVRGGGGDEPEYKLDDRAYFPLNS
jgi:hypothetical protein